MIILEELWHHRTSKQLHLQPNYKLSQALQSFCLGDLHKKVRDDNKTGQLEVNYL